MMLAGKEGFGLFITRGNNDLQLYGYTITN